MVGDPAQRPSSALELYAVQRVCFFPLSFILNFLFGLRMQHKVRSRFQLSCRDGCLTRSNDVHRLLSRQDGR